MARWKRSWKSPGGPPLCDRRALYIKLMNQDESNVELRAFVAAHLKLRWSPEQISARLAETVATYLWHREAHDR